MKIDFSILLSKISFLQNILISQFSIDTIYICGGSARSILDYCFCDKDLEMRDIDLFVTLSKNCTFEYVKNIGQILNSTCLGEFLFALPKFRVKSIDSEYFEAGYGMSLKDENDIITDLTFFHPDFDLNMNGVFDIEAIRIPLYYEQNLLSFQKLCKNYSLTTLLKNKLINDPYNGYDNWINKNPRIVNWQSVKYDPIICAIRIARIYSKLGYQNLPDDIYLHLKEFLESNTKIDKQMISKNLEKIKLDSNPEGTYSILNNLEIFKYF